MHVFDDPSTSAATTESTGGGDTTAALAADPALVVLVVGTDRGLPAHEGPIAADSILVVRLDPAGSRVRATSSGGTAQRGSRIPPATSVAWTD